MRDAAPEVGQRLAGALASALGEAVRQHGGVHGAGAGGGDALDVDAAVLHQLVEHAPGEGAVRAAALQRQVDGLGLRGARRAARGLGLGGSVRPRVQARVPGRDAVPSAPPNAYSPASWRSGWPGANPKVRSNRRA